MRRLVLVAALFFAAVSLGAPSAAATTGIPTCLSNPATIYGKSGVINGTSGPDVIMGGQGGDVICGMGGDGYDVLLGGDYSYDCDALGDDNDLILGGTGNDYVLDPCGNNTAHGDAGSDDLREVSGTADGGSGDNVLVYAYNGIFTCGEENQDYYAAHARGGSGSDTLCDYEFSGAVTLDGGAGRDTCDPNGADDTLIRCEVMP